MHLTEIKFCSKIYSVHKNGGVMNINALIFLILSAFFGSLTDRAAAQNVSTQSKTMGIVSITFDDARDSYGIELAIAKKNNIKGTLFVTTGLVGNQSYMSWKQIREFADAGWEIGAHTISHSDLTMLPDNLLQDELLNPIQDIFLHVGRNPVSFATPYGEFDNRVISSVMKYYKNHSGAWIGNAGGGFNNISGIDHYRIGRKTIMSTQSIQEICSDVESAAKNGSWLVLMFHRIIPNDQKLPGDYDIFEQTFEGITSCINDFSVKGAIRVRTIAEALQSIPQKN